MGDRSTLASDGVVLCAGGLRIAERSAAPESRADLSVAAVRAIARPQGPPFESRLSDGFVWRRHWADGGRLVVEIVDIAVVEVDDATATITVDRVLDPEMEQHLIFDHVLPLVLARSGAIVLHGAVISRGGRGIALMGKTGAGKSTLTAYAWQQGWTIGGDDGAVLHPDGPLVEPTYSTVRLTEAAARLIGVDPSSCSPIVGKLRLPASSDGDFDGAPVELIAIVAVEPAGEGGAAAFERLDAIDAHARLFAGCFHADFSGEARLPALMTGLASVVEEALVGRLTVPRGLEGLAEAERSLTSIVAVGDVQPGRAPR
jgi:hypothetical protein